MRGIMLFSAIGAAFLGGCATTDGLPSMSAAEITECLQPNRRVVVEVGGRRPAPPPKPKPDAKPEAKVEAKPVFANVQLKAAVQGNSAFDVGSAVLKDGGKKELDSLMAQIAKGPVTVNAVIVSGHTDRQEASSASKSLSEDRARAAVAYLASKGLDQKLVFWEGKADKDPVPVTKFCQ